LRQLRGEALGAREGEALAAEAGEETTKAKTKKRQIPDWLWKIIQQQQQHRYTPPQYAPQPSYTPHYGGSGGGTTMYMYRSKNAKNYEDTNVNMANLPGVMWYLHNEVVRVCPRKFGITRVLRYKVTMMPTMELKSSMHGSSFAHLCHFDSGACTGPSNSLRDYQRYGYAVGCDKPSTHTAAYKDATWYSLPGSCPRMTFSAKSRNPTCHFTDPGGECKPGEAWSKTCTWRKEYAGEVSLQELTGVPPDRSWCKQGNFEWQASCDCGHGTSFWNGKRNMALGSQRVEKLRGLFARKYPTMPADFGEARCPFGDRNR